MNCLSKGNIFTLFGNLDESSKLFTSCTIVIFVMANCKGNHHCAWRRQTANALPHRRGIIKLLPKWLQNFKWLHAIGPKIREKFYTCRKKTRSKQAAEENYSLKVLTVNFLLLPLHDDKVFWQRRKKNVAASSFWYYILTS